MTNAPATTHQQRIARLRDLESAGLLTLHRHNEPRRGRPGEYLVKLPAECAGVPCAALVGHQVEAFIDGLRAGMELSGGVVPDALTVE